MALAYRIGQAAARIKLAQTPAMELGGRPAPAKPAAPAPPASSGVRAATPAPVNPAVNPAVGSSLFSGMGGLPGAVGGFFKNPAGLATMAGLLGKPGQMLIGAGGIPLMAAASNYLGRGGSGVQALMRGPIGHGQAPTPGTTPPAVA